MNYTDEQRRLMRASDCEDSSLYPHEAVRTAFENGATIAEQLYQALCGLGSGNCWCPDLHIGDHTAQCLKTFEAVQAYRLHKF